MNTKPASFLIASLLIAPLSLAGCGVEPDDELLESSEDDSALVKNQVCTWTFTGTDGQQIPFEMRTAFGTAGKTANITGATLTGSKNKYNLTGTIVDTKQWGDYDYAAAVAGKPVTVACKNPKQEFKAASVVIAPQYAIASKWTTETVTLKAGAFLPFRASGLEFSYSTPSVLPHKLAVESSDCKFREASAEKTGSRGALTITRGAKPLVDGANCIFRVYNKNLIDDVTLTVKTRNLEK